MAQHTPGQWSYHTRDHPITPAWQEVIIKANGWEPIATTMPERPGERLDRAEANACLIASAPDLLAALKALLWQYDHYGNLYGMALQDARAAIARAEGHSPTGGVQ
jgi:hypothetical protein